MRRLRIVRNVAIVLIALVIVAGAVGAAITVPYYAITPGTALNVSSLISVPAAASHRHRGQIDLTDVELVPLRALTYLYYELDHDAQIVPNDEVVGAQTAAQYDEEGVIDMANAREAATVSGLRELGYPVRAVPSGVEVYATAPKSPAAATLAVGDVITSIDHSPTLSFATLSAQLERDGPGASVPVSWHALGSSRSKVSTLRLGLARQQGSGANVSLSCARFGAVSAGTVVRRNGKEVGCLGIAVEQQYVTTGAPFSVVIDADGIIGPSAGLAFALGLVQSLDRADLTGGMRIAATGTMSVDGAVGDVGGVAQKTVAVRNAGARLFFVPPQERAVAQAHAGSTLRIVAVSSLHQAIETLEHLGGRLEK